MDPKGARRDAEVARIAARQHGVVSLAQLIRSGLSPTAVRERLRAGRLHRVHRGVYAVGHAGLGHEARWMAAVLACGEGAVLSHRSAAELWELLPRTGGTVHVTVPTAGGRKRRTGIRLHRCPSLLRSETTLVKGIAVTKVARTLTDLRGSVPAAELRRAIREAEFRGLDPGDVPTDHTRSELEAAFLRLCRRHGLPEPEVNARIGRFTVDFYWPEARLAVETDGYRAHRGRQAFEDDRERELELSLRGIRLQRLTGRQLRRDERLVVAALRRALV